MNKISLIFNFLIFCFCSPLIAATEKLPNVVLILTDDLGYGDIGCYGSIYNRTPAIDRLAREGTRFTDFYVAAAQCSPTRAALLTGSYAQRINTHRLFNQNAEAGLNPDEITLPELLRERGYATGLIGKWHLGHHEPFHPNNHGFDYFWGYLNPAYFSKQDRLIHRNAEIVARGPERHRITDDLTQETVEFIDRNKDRPFFVILSHDMPHIPLELPQEMRGRSAGGFYGDVIEHIDDTVAAVREAIERNGIADRTLLMFTSDNGPAYHWGIEGGTPGPLRGAKHTTLEGGFRVPFIVWGPGIIPAGRVSHAMCNIMDFYPTFVERAGGAVPDDRVIDGKNIWDLLTGKTEESPHDAFFYYKILPNALSAKIESVRQGDWKLRIPLKVNHEKALEMKLTDYGLTSYDFDEDGNLPPMSTQQKHVKKNQLSVQAEAARETVALYNLKNDPGERHNLAAEHPNIVNSMTRLMREFDLELRENSRPIGTLETAATP